jgi:ATP-binding cassette subfamily B protein
VLAVTAVVLAVGETAQPAVLGRAIDAVIRPRGSTSGASTSWLTWYAVLVAVLVVFATIDDLAAGAATAQSTAWLRRRLTRHVLGVGPRATDRFTPGDAASRLVGNAAQVGRVAPDAVRGVANLVPAVGAMVALALIDPWLCLTFVAGLPILVLLIRAFAREVSGLAAAYLEVQGRIAARLVDALSGARTIAASGTVDREVERVLEPLPELHSHGVGMWYAQSRITAQDALLMPLLQIAVLAVAGAELSRGRITPGQMLAAGEYVVLAATLSSAVTAVTRLARARAGAERADEVLRQPVVGYGPVQMFNREGRVEFRGVTARVGGKPVLNGLDLVVPAGALVALVGQSGAGKSLLAALVGRLIDPDEGEVWLDGVPLPWINRGDLRCAVGYGFERPVLMGETLADVITFGYRRPSAEEVLAASRAAWADEFICRMPDGYRTRLADAPMSGGEYQRLGLARAFAHAGLVIVLDDVAASLDTVTEHRISEVLTRELAGRTRLVVAHRASTAARADVVAWLDCGRIRAMAPHHELWRDWQYRALFEPVESPEKADKVETAEQAEQDDPGLVIGAAS